MKKQKPIKQLIPKSKNKSAYFSLLENGRQVKVSDINTILKVKEKFPTEFFSLFMKEETHSVQVFNTICDGTFLPMVCYTSPVWILIDQLVEYSAGGATGLADNPCSVFSTSVFMKHRLLMIHWFIVSIMMNPSKDMKEAKRIKSLDMEYKKNLNAIKHRFALKVENMSPPSSPQQYQKFLHMMRLHSLYGIRLCEIFILKYLQVPDDQIPHFISDECIPNKDMRIPIDCLNQATGDLKQYMLIRQALWRKRLKKTDNEFMWSEDPSLIKGDIVPSPLFLSIPGKACEDLVNQFFNENLV